MLLGACVASLNRDEDSSGWYLSVKSGPDSVAGDGCGDDLTQAHGPFDHVISSASIAAILNAIEVPLPKAALEAAAQIQFRDFILVALISGEEISPQINVFISASQIARLVEFKILKTGLLSFWTDREASALGWTISVIDVMRSILELASL